MANKPPTPSMPPGVRPSGNNKFVAAAVVLLLVIGGVVVWKLTQKPPEPVVALVDAGPPPPPTTGRNPDDEVPPPPPEEDSGAGQKKIIRVVQSNQCDAKKCTGATTSELEQMLAFRVKQAHRCYDQALALDSTLKGKVSISVRIGANGGVCSAGIASNDMGSPNVANCVVNNYFRGANFPAPKGGCADINIPINFVPRQ